MSEIHPAVEANNVHKIHSFNATTSRKSRRRKATLAFLTRAAVGVCILLLIVVLHKFEQISDSVAFVSIFVADGWLAWLLGAWMQLMWGVGWLR